MCGITGYTGKENALPILMEGLKKLNTEAMIRRASRYSTRAT